MPSVVTNTTGSLMDGPGRSAGVYESAVKPPWQRMQHPVPCTEERVAPAAESAQPSGQTKASAVVQLTSTTIRTITARHMDTVYANRAPALRCSYQVGLQGGWPNLERTVGVWVPHVSRAKRGVSRSPQIVAGLLCSLSNFAALWLLAHHP